MRSFIDLWAKLVLKWRWLVIISTGAIFWVCLSIGSNIPFNSSDELFFVEGDPNLNNYQRLIELFGDNEYLVVGIQAGPEDKDVFEPEILRIIARLTEFLENQASVTQVRSLTRYQYTDVDDDLLTINDLIGNLDEYASSASAREHARKIMANQKLALGTLVSNDLRHTRIAARVEYQRHTSQHKIDLVRAFNEFVTSHELDQLGYRIRVSGRPLLNERVETLANQDSKYINLLMIIVIFVALCIGFRSFYAALFPWLVIIAGIFILLGIQGGILGYPHTTIDGALISILIIIGIGFSVHILVEFFMARSIGMDAKQAATSSIQKLWKPTFFSCLTTSLGFGALSVTELVPVRQFAILGTIGPIIIFLLTLTVLPALLSFCRKFSPLKYKLINAGTISKLTSALPEFTHSNRHKILALGGLMALFSVVTVPQLKLDTNVLNFFKSGTPVRQDMAYFDAVFTGAMGIEVVIDSGKEGGVLEPQFLSRVEHIQSQLEAMETIGEVNSLVDYLKQINRTLNGNDALFFRLPESREMVAQMLFLYQNSGPDEDLSDIQDFDQRYLRLTLPIVNMPSSQLSRELDKIQKMLDQDLGDLGILLTGDGVMFHAQDMYSSEGMVKSFSLALIVIAIAFIILFKSLKYGVLAIVPSILPILMTGGIMAVVGVDLDLGAMIVAAMIMGIAVDDAIHFMERYLSSKKQGLSTTAAIQQATTHSGRAVILSSIILILGFGMFVLSNFIPKMLVGVLGSCIILLALVGDLIFLPALLHTLDKDDQ